MQLHKILVLAAFVFGGLCAPPSASAAVVQWNVDSSASSVKLTIPDQSSWLANTLSATLRVRNQNGTAWTTNVAPLSGTLNTNYAVGSSIQFLSNPVGQLVGLNSGNYRPNPAAFNPSNTDADNPQGQFEDSSLAPGVFGFRLNTSYLLFNFSLGYFSAQDVAFDVTSGVLGLNGSGQFAANSSSLGISGGTLAIDGAQTSVIGQALADDVVPFGPMIGTNTAPTGAITIPDPVNQPFQHRLQLPFSVPISYAIEGVPFNGTLSGTIVAYTIVPEPSSVALAGLGAVGLVALGYRRRKR